MDLYLTIGYNHTNLARSIPLSRKASPILECAVTCAPSFLRSSLPILSASARTREGVDSGVSNIVMHFPIFSNRPSLGHIHASLCTESPDFFRSPRCVVDNLNVVLRSRNLIHSWQLSSYTVKSKCPWVSGFHHPS